MAFIRIYALFTMLQTQWGNREVNVVHNEVTRTGKFAVDEEQVKGDKEDAEGKDELWDIFKCDKDSIEVSYLVFRSGDDEESFCQSDDDASKASI
jgi:hypothetical protein